MEVNKIVIKNINQQVINTPIDLTEDTATEDKVLEGYTFHKADGTQAVGTYTGGQPTPSDSWYAIGEFNNWTPQDSSYELIETDLEYIANNIDSTIASNLSTHNFDKVYFTQIQLGAVEGSTAGPFEYNNSYYTCSTSILFSLVKGMWERIVPGENDRLSSIDSSNGQEVGFGLNDGATIPIMFTVNGAGNYYLVVAENELDNTFYIALNKFESIQSEYGDLIPYVDQVTSVSLIGDMTNWDTDIYFTKDSDLQYSLSNYSFDYENYSLPFFAIRINENFNYSSTNYTNINYEFQDFPNNNDYSSYFTRFNTGESIQCLKGCKVNISVVLDSNTRQGFANSTITFTWLQDIAEPTFEINSLDLVGTQNDWSFRQTPFTLDSGSASGQGIWVLSNNSFSQDDHFLFAVNGSWDITGGRDWSNFIFSNFPNNNDYSSYLQAPGEPPLEDNTIVLQSFIGTVTISVDAEQVDADRNLSSATITISYVGV